MDNLSPAESESTVSIRPADGDDLGKVVELDGRITGLAKPDFWGETFERFVGRDGRHFLIAETAEADQASRAFVGFIVGEMRAWEFGSQPCGWILTILVNPDFQGQGIGERLFAAICQRLKQDGAGTIRTMIAREDSLNMSFFRAQGMMAGPFIELEMPID